MPLDPAVAELLDTMKAEGAPPIHQVPVEEARARPDTIAALSGDGAPVASQTDRMIAGVRCTVYTPEGEGPFPVLVWVHGGGWVICRPGHYHAICRDLAAGAGCIVVSVDYRLAPEHKAPAASDDCSAVVAWLLDHAGDLGADAARVAVGGDSAGGNLSALMAIRFGRRLSGQLLVYPATDLTATSPSVDEFATGLFLEKESMRWFIGHYLDGTGIEPDDPRVSPAFAADEVLAATAPAFLITAEYDPLRDKGESYGARLASLGVDATTKRYGGMIHAFYVMRDVTAVAAEAIDDSTAFLRRVLGSG